MSAKSFFNPPPGPKCPDALQKKVFNSPTNECALESGFSFWVVQEPPTADEITGICASASCKEVVDTIVRAQAKECVTFDGFYLYKDLVDPIVNQCRSGATPTPTTLAPIPENKTWSIPTDAPEAVSTPSPSPSSDSSAGASSPWGGWTSSTTSPSPDSFINAGSSLIDRSLSTFTIVAIVAASIVGVVVITVAVMCLSQRNTRDPTVQQTQHLSYRPIGDVPTETTRPRPSPVYTAVPVGGAVRQDSQYKSCVPQEPCAPTYAPSTQSALSRSSNVTVDASRMPLLDDEQITAVRIPFGKIELGQRLNSGGYGEVYISSYKDQKVAVKTLLPQHRQSIAHINGILHEAKLMASLEHEHIVVFVGVAWDAISDIRLLSEFMEGGDLRTTLKNWDQQGRPMGFDATKTKIALHVAHALVYLHSLQPVVLHRDLKSSNILLNRDFDAKLTDFGVSRERAESTMTRGVGTSLWMAPEVMAGGKYDDKADIFSLGVVLSELDTNKLPYASMTDVNGLKTTAKVLELMQSVALGRLTVEFSYASDPDLVAIGRACVAVNPADRPSAPEVLHRIHNASRQFV